MCERGVTPVQRVDSSETLAQSSDGGELCWQQCARMSPLP